MAANPKYNFVLVRTQKVSGENVHTVSDGNVMEVHNGTGTAPTPEELTNKIKQVVDARAEDPSKVFQTGGNKRRSNALRTRSRARRSKVGGKRSRARRTKSKRSKSTRRR